MTTYNTDRLFGYIQDTFASRLDRTPLLAPYLSDSGTVTATAVMPGDEVLADTPPTSTTTVTDGTLGNNGTHESYVTDIVYVEAYTLTTSAIVQSYQWQGKGDNSHLDQHWKFLIYLDNGSGAPGALLYVSPEQTVSSVDSTVTTQTYSPTALSIPSGTLWVGIHLNEAHLAPTYTHGGNALDASDEYDDGPNDPFSGGGNTNDNLRDRLLTYIPNAANVALVILTGSGSLTDAGTGAATVTAVAVLSGAEALLEQAATVTAVAVPSGAEALLEQAATLTAVAVLSDTEALADAATVTAVVDVSGAQDLTVNASEDSGSLTATVVLSGLDSLSDSGSVTATVVLSGVGSVAKVDSGLVTALAGPFTSAASVSPIILFGTVTSVVVLSATAREVDTGSLTAVAVPTGADNFGERATVTVTAVITVTEFVGDGELIAAGVILGQDEALAQAATLTAIADLQAQDAIGDADNVIAVSVVGGEDGIGDDATEIATANITSPFSSVAWTEVGECDATAVITGFGFEDSPTGSKKGFAYPSMALRYRSDPEDARLTR